MLDIIPKALITYMPKLKTNSSLKKRCKLTAKNKLVMGSCGKNHFMRHKSNKQSRNLRGTRTIETTLVKRLQKYLLPYGR